MLSHDNVVIMRCKWNLFSVQFGVVIVAVAFFSISNHFIFFSLLFSLSLRMAAAAAEPYFYKHSMLHNCNLNSFSFLVLNLVVRIQVLNVD